MVFLSFCWYSDIDGRVSDGGAKHVLYQGCNWSVFGLFKKGRELEGNISEIVNLGSFLRLSTLEVSTILSAFARLETHVE